MSDYTEGENVRVVWSGGNGPHVYVVKHDRFRNPCFHFRGRHGRPEVFVGWPHQARTIDRVRDGKWVRVDG